jgi:DNA-directed RNA polymerase specialized sigma24 family protein
VPLLRADGRPPAPEPGESLAFTALGQVLARIPLREREVLVLYYVADLPVEQIAHDRGIPVGTVRSRLAAGRRRLELGLAQDQARIPCRRGTSSTRRATRGTCWSSRPRDAAGGQSIGR